jgi:ribonuclease HII
MMSQQGSKFIPSNEHEQVFWSKGILVAGIDEAGRGALAGPVVAAAVVFPFGASNAIGCRDSKVLSEEQRNILYHKIHEHAIAIGIGIIDHEMIDMVNIRVATRLAMTQALESIQEQPMHALIDGNYFEHPTIPFSTIIKGDHHCFSIAAASIIAKVTRDSILKEIDTEVDSLYYFAKNKGYGTAEHRNAIQVHGPSHYHRKTFLGKIIQNE